MPGLTKKAKTAYAKDKSKKILTKKNNSAVNKKKKNLGVWGIGRKIIDQVAQLKKSILNPRVGTGVLTDKITGGRTKLKGSPKTKLKIAKKSLKDSKKRIKEGRVKL